jgi:hypothetical protein
VRESNSWKKRLYSTFVKSSFRISSTTILGASFWSKLACSQGVSLFLFSPGDFKLAAADPCDYGISGASPELYPSSSYFVFATARRINEVFDPLASVSLFLSISLQRPHVISITEDIHISFLECFRIENGRMTTNHWLLSRILMPRVLKSSYHCCVEDILPLNSYTIQRSVFRGGAWYLDYSKLWACQYTSSRFYLEPNNDCPVSQQVQAKKAIEISMSFSPVSRLLRATEPLKRALAAFSSTTQMRSKWKLENLDAS